MVIALLIVGLFAFAELAWPVRTDRGELLYRDGNGSR
jgi:hypothetical protein